MGWSAAALAIMAAGTAAQTYGSISAGKAQTRASTDFLDRQTQLMRQQQLDNQAAQAQIALQQQKQQQLRDQSGAEVDAAIEQNAAPVQHNIQDDLTDQRAQGYQRISDLNPISIDIGSSAGAPTVVGDAIAKSIAKAKAFSDQQAKAKAAIEGFGDLNNRNQLALKSTAGNIKTLGTENDVSSIMARQQQDYMNTLAGITSGQIATAGTSANSRLQYDKSKAGNVSTIGDILFKAGSMGYGAAGNGAKTTTTTQAPTTYGPYYSPS